MKPSLSPLDPSAFKAVCAHAKTELVLPTDAVRISAGLKSNEPFLVPRNEIPASNELNRFVRILSAIYRRAPKRFDEVAPKIRGRTRIYFAQTATEIHASGSSNSAARIPESPWYVSVNSDGRRKAIIITDLMCALGFSPDYAFMVSSLCYDNQPRLPIPYERALHKLSND